MNVLENEVVQAKIGSEIKVNGVESTKIVTKVQTFGDCALLQWNVR